MALSRNLSTVVYGLLAATLFATACGTQSGSRDMTAARAGFQNHVAQCSARHGYTAEEGSKLGPYVLGANERGWRECVYQGIEQFLVPSSLTPEIYRRAIAEDRKLTDSVAAGRMTRAERAARVREMLTDIERTEKANDAKIAQMEDTERLVKEEAARQQDPMRRALMVPLMR